jgi:AcrR family transcriptional regulator
MREARAGIEDPPGRLRAIGHGYVAFARRYPERFRLVFSWHRLNHDDPALRRAGGAAFAELEAAVRLATGAHDAPLRGDLLIAIVNAWSAVHGFSHLLLQGQFDNFLAGGGEAALDDLLGGVLAKMAPVEPGAERSGSPSDRGDQERQA